MKLVILGAPGAGKGTQAHFLSLHYDVPHISTGNLLREQMRLKTPIGIEIEHLVNKGMLAPDDIVISVLMERIAKEDCAEGFILDGYPRNAYQAEISENVVGELDAVVSVHVDDEVIIRRMSGRRICNTCGATYHLDYKPPAKSGLCDNCGGQLIQRIDDKSKTVKERLKIYHKDANPIKEYYDSIGLLRVVDGTKEINEITDDIIAALDI